MDLFETIAYTYQEEIDKFKNVLAQGQIDNYENYRQMVGYISGIEWAKQNLRDIAHKHLYIEEE
tara:strand:- start:165 stop:356 length:192 start_codon:yes stop_codon:yes gene_type:complete